MRGRSRSVNLSKNNRTRKSDFSDSEGESGSLHLTSSQSSVGSLYSGSDSDGRDSVLSVGTTTSQLDKLQKEFNQIEENFENQGVSLKGWQQLDNIILDVYYLKVMKKNPKMKEKFARLYEQAIDFFAESRIAYSRQLFAAIPENEFKAIFDKSQDTPFYNQLTQDFISSSLLIQFDILKRETLRQVLLAIERWSLILKKCIDAGDFHGEQIIMSALNNFPIKRLTKSAKKEGDLPDLVSIDVVAILLKAAELEKSNYKLLREAMSDKNSISYLGLYLQDYEFSQQGAPKEKYIQDTIEKLKAKQTAIRSITVDDQNFWKAAETDVESSSGMAVDFSKDDQFDEMLDKQSYKFIPRDEKPLYRDHPSKSYEFLQAIRSESLGFIVEKIYTLIENNPVGNVENIEGNLKDIVQTKKDKGYMDGPLLRLVGELEKYKNVFLLEAKPNFFRRKNPIVSELSEIIVAINVLRAKMPASKTELVS